MSSEPDWHDWIRRCDTDEDWRRHEFPIARNKVFLAHAAVTTLPRAVAAAMNAFNEACATDFNGFGDVIREVNAARQVAARLIGAGADEIALLGPTSLGLSLVARGLPWQSGDEIICYRDDYPANVYPWMQLEKHGVRTVFLEPTEPGRITPELVAAAITPRTRLVALASCHFFTGYRIDIEAIGRLVHDAGALFCLDAIQTLGAFPVDVTHVDFLSADAHKWLLGPMAAGVVYVDRRHFDLLEPALIGAWNVSCPNFITRDRIEFEPGARRYEPGVLNVSGICGMRAAMEMLLGIGIHRVSERLLDLRSVLEKRLQDLDFEPVVPGGSDWISGIASYRREGGRPLEEVADALTAEGVVASLRHDRSGRAHLRFSPHFYNTVAELDRVVDILARLVR